MNGEPATVVLTTTAKPYSQLYDCLSEHPVNWFRNMSFTGKLLLPIGLVALIMTALSANSLRVFSSFLEDSNIITQRLGPSTEYLLNMDRDMYQAVVAELDILFEAMDQQQLEEHAQEHRENLDQVAERAQKVAVLLTDAEQQAKLEAFSRYFKEWRAASEQRISAKMTGQSSEGAERTDAEAQFEQARQELDELVDLLAAQEAALEHKLQLEADQGKSSQIVGLIIGLMTCIAMAFVGPRLIVRPLDMLRRSFDDISKGSGDLTARVPVNSKDEIGKISFAFNRFMDNLQAMVREIASVTGHVNQASGSLKGVLSGTELSVKQQYQALDMIVTAVNEMGASAHDVARSTLDAASEAKKADQSSQLGEKILHDTTRSIRELAVNVEGAAETVSQFERETANIVTILNQIQAVAAQTNLLALNAAIEAARAGEQGRGFAVVADEVRALANKTQEATGSINNLIERLKQGVQGTVSAMTESTGHAHASVESADKASDAFKEIAGAVERISEMSTQIASSAEQQSAVVEDINKNILEVNQLSEASAQSAADALAEVDQLSDMANRLDSIVKRFKIA